MRVKHAPHHQRRSSSLRVLGCGLALSLAFAGGLGCDKEADKKADAKAETKEAPKGPSDEGKKLQKEIDDLKAEIAKGEDVKFGCVANLAQYEDLAKSSNEDDKKLHADLVNVCFVDAPNKMIADLRAKIEKGEEVDTFATVDLDVLLKDEKFPKEGEPAKVAEDAKKLLEVELPTHRLNAELKVAKEEKEKGEMVSMGCIKAKQIVDESAKALEGDEKGKAALDTFNELCPEKE